MMQMLVAGGMTPLADGERPPDADNPRGYLEWERIKTLPNDPGCITEAEGKVVKVISWLLLSVPPTHEYKVIFMQRPLAEVMASQDEMRRRRGTYKQGADLTATFEKHLHEVDAWMDTKPYVQGLRVSYHEALKEPRKIADRLKEFLALDLKIDAMIAQVDQSLYRNREN